MIDASSTSTPVAEFDQSVSGRIAQELADKIISGALAPGSRLMQDHLASEFGASHVPVREAFRKLEAQGLVVSKPRCGVRVSDLDPAVVLEVTEMRAALESLALYHSLGRLTDSSLDAARQALVEGEASDRIVDWEGANRRFHLTLIEPCGMPRLLATIYDLHRSASRFLYATWKHLDWQPRSDAEHWAILDAITRDDGVRARALLEAHVRDAGKALVDRLHATTAQEDVA
jgi:DNA-binding GntR family transcriptional regulator